MNKRSRIWALLGASVLTLGVVSIALAVDLKESQQGITITWDEEGNPSAVDSNGDPFEINGTDCEGVDLEEGEIAIHFVQSPTEADSGTLDVDFDGAADVSGLASSGGQGAQVDWDVLVTATADEVVIVSATSSIADGELKISHICVGENPPDETAPPSFEQSQGGETDTPTDTPTATPTDTPTEAPTFEQSQGGQTDAPTDEPSFEQSQGGETEAPSEPDTTAIGNGGPSTPADSAWLLVVALGVLLASVVVLTPARAKR